MCLVKLKEEKEPLKGKIKLFFFVLVTASASLKLKEEIKRITHKSSL